MRVISVRLLRSHLLSLLSVALLAAGCGHPKPLPTIRLAANYWPGYEHLYLAEQLGYFKEEGLQVHLVETLSLNDSVHAYEIEQVDAIAATLTELAFLREQTSRRPQVFYACDYSCGADVILARESIDSVSELAGKRVAAEPNSVNMALLLHALRLNQMNLADVHVIPMPQASMASAARDGRIDAAVTYTPTTSHIQQIAGWHQVFDSSAIPFAILDVLAAEAGSLASEPESYASLIRAFDRARVFAAQHPEEALGLLARRVNATPDDVQISLAGMRLVSLAEQEDCFGSTGRIAQAVAAATTPVPQADGEPTPSVADWLNPLPQRLARSHSP